MARRRRVWQAKGGSGEQALAQGHEDAQKDGAQEVTGNADGGAADYQAALRAKDARIAELQGKVASTAKTAEATSSCLNSPARMARGAQREGDHDP